MAEQIFMTGGTGLVGTNLIPRLLRTFPGSTVTLLVRGDNDADVASRIDVISLNVERGEEGIPGARDRIRGLRGDVLLDQCGLSGSELDTAFQSAENMIGEEGQAFYYATSGLETARAHTAARLTPSSWDSSVPDTAPSPAAGPRCASCP